MARQYANPSGWFGRLFTAGLLNRANNALNRAAFTALELNNHSRFLEIGFGGGDLIFDIAKNSTCREISGIDPSEPMVKRGQEYLARQPAFQQVNLYVGAVQSLPFSNNQFNRLCSINTVYFWPDLNAGCKEIARVSEPHCRVVLGFSSGMKLSQAGYSEHGFSFYQPESIHQAMSDNGLDLKTVKELERKNKDTFYISIYTKNDT